MLITNANIITWEKPNRILEHHAILIEKNIIQRIGSTVDLLDQYPAEDQLDAGGQYVMPGNICAHTHFYGAFARGLAVPDPAPENFIQILEKLWWPLDKALTEEDIRASALVWMRSATPLVGPELTAAASFPETTDHSNCPRGAPQCRQE